MHYAVPILLHRQGMLERLYTDIYADGNSLLGFSKRVWPKGVPQGPIKHIFQRSTSELPASKVTSFDLIGIRYATALRMASNKQRTNLYLRHAKSFLTKIAEQQSIFDSTIVYGFSHVMMEILEHLQHHDVKIVLEQQTPPTSEYAYQVNQESELWPSWECNTPIFWDIHKWTQRENAEWSAADRILVPSSYVQEQLILRGVADHKIMCVPYGVSTHLYKGAVSNYEPTRPLRILFVGRVQLAKGVQYLIEALKYLKPNNVEIRLVGGLHIQREYLVAPNASIEVIGRVPRSEVQRHYAWADVFVLPSVCEGSATVVYEALANGLPVITTPNSGTLVEEGKTGFIVPVRDSEQIADRLSRFVDEPLLVEQMSQTALDGAEKYSWENYERNLTAAIWNLTNNKEIAKSGS